jgi:hypothetical protein
MLPYASVMDRTARETTGRLGRRTGGSAERWV